MPYRRLPNTDQSRIRALHTAIDRCSRTAIPELACSIKSKNEAETILPIFESAHHAYLLCLERQVAAGKKFQSQVKLTRLYISHFIQVLNFNVIRNEIKRELKKLYGLDPNDFTVPDLNSETALLNWGERIIAGEQERIRQGGAPIYNPAIAKVRVHFDIFKDGGIAQKTHQKSTNRSLEAITQMRQNVDSIILDLWNEVEAHFQNYPEVQRRTFCESYGIRYYFRKNEPRE